MSPEEAHAEAVRRIERARAEGARRLDLGDLHDLPLYDLPQELGSLSDLRDLVLGGRYGPSRTERWFADLNILRDHPRLEHLDLSGCREVRDIGPLAGLTALRSLDLSRCDSVTDVGPLAGLTALQSLDLWMCNCITDIGPLAGLTVLQSLNLGGCDGVTDAGPLAGLTALQSLNLEECDHLTHIGPLAGLTALQWLDLSGCDGVTNVGPLACLTALRSLNLSYTGVTDIGPLAGLTELKQLDLTECWRLRRYDKLHEALPALQRLCLYGCRFDDLPELICGESPDDNVFDKVRAHFADLERGAVEDAEVKLFVLGNGRVGKTQMCRRLCQLPYDATISTTHGVHLDQFSLPLEGHSTPVRVRFWDFGGQDVYHGTHALFLQGHAVLVVLWTPDREEGDADENGVPIRHRPLAYWLDYIRGLAGTDSPILVVQSQCDEPKQRRAPPRAHTEDFRFLKFLEFSARTDLGLDALTGLIKEGVRNLVAGRPLHLIGTGRADVRARLRALLKEDQTRPPVERRHRTLTQKKYRAICRKTGKITNEDALLDFLHRSGVVFYQPGLFNDAIILDQAWALDAIYTVFHRQRTLPYLYRGGRFTRPMLAQLVWQAYSEKEQKTFLGMMQSCGICFRARNLSGDDGHPEWEYIAPDLLPEWSGVQDQLFGRLRETEPAAGAVVRYTFLHEGILRTFLSQIGQRAGDAAVYWKYGCWFGEQTTRGEMLIQSSTGTSAERPGAGEITLSAWGDGAVKLVDNVLETLLRAPVGQPPEVTRTGGSERRPAPGAEKSVGGVENLVMTARSPLADDRVKRVFISYAWGDGTPQGRERGEVVEGLCEKLRAWDYDVIRDKKDMRRGDLISVFMRRIGRGRRVVMILSEKYLRSVYCMKELYEIYLNSRGKKRSFLRRIIPLTLADAKIITPEERGEHARYWRQRAERLQPYVADGSLGKSDMQQWVEMSRWATEVSEILSHIADLVHPTTIAEIVADDFAAVRELLERGS